MGVVNQLDYIDQEILLRLEKDSRTSFLNIAKALNISNSLVQQRVNKLKENGVIKKFGIQISQQHLGYNTSAYMGIVLKEAHYSYEVAKAMLAIPEVVECNYVSGQYALFIKIVAANNEHLREIVYEKVHLIQGVGSTDSFISFGPEKISFGEEFKRSAPIRV